MKIEDKKERGSKAWGSLLNLFTPIYMIGNRYAGAPLGLPFLVIRVSMLHLLVKN